MTEQPPQSSPAEDETGEPEPRLQPRIYVASLSDYNAGRLHGAWLEADAEPADLGLGITAMLAGSPEPSAEEYAIHDYDGFGGIQLDEHESLENVSQLARGLTRLGPAYAAFVREFGLEDATQDSFEQQYRGSWASARDFVLDLLDEFGAADLLQELPPWLAPYVEVNYDAFVSDLRQGAEIAVVNHPEGVCVFNLY